MEELVNINEDFLQPEVDECPICSADAIVHGINCDLEDETWECLVCGSTFSE